MSSTTVIAVAPVGIGLDMRTEEDEAETLSKSLHTCLDLDFFYGNMRDVSRFSEISHKDFQVDHSPLWGIQPGAAKPYH